MTKAVLSLLLLSTLVTQAQQTNLLPRSRPQSDLLIAVLAPANDTSEPAGANGHSAKPAYPEAKPPADSKKKAPPKKDTDEIKRPTIESSMVGYIENAIVGSEVRIRFDAAFNDAFPDRAEFIYAKCGCYRNPGGGRSICARSRTGRSKICKLSDSFVHGRVRSSFTPFRFFANSNPLAAARGCDSAPERDASIS